MRVLERNSGPLQEQLELLMLSHLSNPHSSFLHQTDENLR